VARAQKSGYDSFMRKEIDEQPAAIRDTLVGRVVGTRLQLDELHVSDDVLREVSKVFVVACGTAFHSGMVAKYAIEHWTRLPVEIEIASEFRYRDPVLGPDTLTLAVSQSGETIDTLEAARHARRQGSQVVAVTNTVGSTLSREADAVIYMHAGPEIGVAATKTFATQMVSLHLVALYLAQVRATMFPELSYVHAEGYPAGELKHGPIALVEEGVPIVAVATQCHVYPKMLSNIQEVRARGADVIAIVTEGDREIDGFAQHVLEVPATPELLSPVVVTVPLQLFAYHVARLRDCDVDQPRNLAKSVTVE
jgi:glucosamine--fructose-6-phosphate aminotransferase (isomerizing)